jgi:mRNA-degrading endonuclease RelE of RelBE toxin-antitoxin system
MRVEVKDQVRDFIRLQAPIPRRRLLAGLTGLETEKGDLMALRGELEGFYRLRVGEFRIVFRYCPGLLIQCVYCNTRDLVYEMFLSRLSSLLD